MARMPAYRTVYYDLKSAIKNEVYPVGSLLPTESELEKQYAVSRVTVRRAVSLLAAEGYVKATQGKGTQVLPFATTQKLGGISSITETLKSRGFTITTQDAYVELVPATAQVAMELQIKEGSPFLIWVMSISGEETISSPHSLTACSYASGSISFTASS